jgi:hypothetical protein
LSTPPNNNNNNNQTINNRTMTNDKSHTKHAYSIFS